MKTIAQRQLRNASGQILREAEAGERFVITVQGRPVALLGPYEARTWVARSGVRAMLATPSDPDWLEDLRAQEPETVRDPWHE